MKRNKTCSKIIHCVYTKNKHNYVSGCGMRAGLNIRNWHYCPFCGKPMSQIWNIRDDEEVKD